MGSLKPKHVPFLLGIGIIVLFISISLITIVNADDRVIVNQRQVSNYVFGNCLYEIDNDKNQEDIQFVLVKGTMTEYDVAAGASTEYEFTGDMQLRVVKNTKILDTYPIIPRNPAAITLPGGDHQLSCHDFNSDGNVDFPLRSDWRTRSDYLIYSVSHDGKISLLPIHNRSRDLPMVDNKRTLSTKEITLEGNLLRVNNAKYNSFLAKNHKGYDEPQVNYYKWDGKAFSSAEPSTGEVEGITAKIHGQFSGYSDMSDWALFVDDIPKDRQGGKGLLPSGEFELIIKDVKPGKYYLRFGDHGSGMLKVIINRPDIDLGVIEHDI